MPSVDQIVSEVTSIRQSSDDLSSMVASAGQQLSGSAMAIAAIVRGSSTGQEAVNAVGVAARSLADASATMLTLSRTCEECVRNLAK